MTMMTSMRTRKGNSRLTKTRTKSTPCILSSSSMKWMVLLVQVITIQVVWSQRMTRTASRRLHQQQHHSVRVPASQQPHHRQFHPQESLRGVMNNNRDNDEKPQRHLNSKKRNKSNKNNDSSDDEDDDRYDYIDSDFSTENEGGNNLPVPIVTTDDDYYNIQNPGDNIFDTPTIESESEFIVYCRQNLLSASVVNTNNIISQVEFTKFLIFICDIMHDEKLPDFNCPNPTFDELSLPVQLTFVYFICDGKTSNELIACLDNLMNPVDESGVAVAVPPLFGYDTTFPEKVESDVLGLCCALLPFLVLTNIDPLMGTLLTYFVCACVCVCGCTIESFCVSHTFSLRSYLPLYYIVFFTFGFLYSGYMS